MQLSSHVQIGFIIAGVIALLLISGSSAQLVCALVGETHADPQGRHSWSIASHSSTHFVAFLKSVTDFVIFALHSGRYSDFFIFQASPIPRMLLSRLFVPPRRPVSLDGLSTGPYSLAFAWSTTWLWLTTSWGDSFHHHFFVTLLVRDFKMFRRKNAEKNPYRKLPFLYLTKAAALVFLYHPQTRGAEYCFAVSGSTHLNRSLSLPQPHLYTWHWLMFVVI